MIGARNMIALFLIKALNDSVLVAIFFKIICKKKIVYFAMPKIQISERI